MNRKRIVTKLFEISQKVYVKHFKKNKIPWKTNRDILLTYPENSLGRILGTFLKVNDFQLLPKVERHDAYHVLVDYGTAPQDEIALQYLCLGNGKQSLYLIGVIILGTLLLPEYFRYYLHSYEVGKKAHPFHHYDYEKLLSQDLQKLREAFFGKAPRHLLKNHSSNF